MLHGQFAPEYLVRPPGTPWSNIGGTHFHIAAERLIYISGIPNQSSNDAPKPVLFKPGHDAASYLALLRNPDYPILNELGEYIYGDKKKSSVTAFFDVLDNRGIIYHYSAKKRAPLINELIPGLNISARVLDTYPELYAQMKPYFEKLISDFLR